MFRRMIRKLRQDDEIDDLRLRNRRLQRKNSRLTEAVDSLGKSAKTSDAETALSEDQIVWIFGSKRTGSTWLADMMSDMDESHLIWREPMIGLLYGHLYYEYAPGVDRERLYSNRHFFLGSTKDVWLRSVRYSVLDGAAGRFPQSVKDGLVIVKEPNGSIGAPVLARSTPSSRLILLVRDPRDVLSSVFDAGRPGGWSARKQKMAAPIDTDRQIGYVSKLFSRSIEAYDDHKGPKTLVRYENLVTDTLSSLTKMYGELGIEVSSEAVERTAEKHSWANVPEKTKGTGKIQATRNLGRLERGSL